MDLGHKRHRLQFLSEPRYEVVRQQWLKQSIPTVVARKLEATMDSGGWQSL
jgi:E3 ubiquitin-protein ligase UBR1